MNVVFDPNISKPLVKWSNKDFLIYFSNCLYSVDHKGLNIPPNGWVVYMSMIKGFRQKLSLSNGRYKQFIDWLVTDIFPLQDFVPNFGCIVSETLFNVFSTKQQAKNNTNNKSADVSDEEFLRIKKEIMSRSRQFPRT
jgi:hypothetical protein